MSVIVPYLLYDPRQDLLPDHVVIKITGALIWGGGFSLFVYTVFLFRMFGSGTLAPWTPTQRLVISGPYRYCRNPMITGVFSMLVGESLFFHSTSILLWALAFFLINTIYFVLKEEPDLEKRFGEDYRAYKKIVPRWIPNVKPYKTAS